MVDHDHDDNDDDDDDVDNHDHDDNGDDGSYMNFFYTGSILNCKFYTQKLTKNCPKHSKMSLKSKIYAVFVFNLENFTPDGIFLLF